MSTYTADDVLFGYRFNRLVFTVPTPLVTDETQDPPVTGRFFAGNTGFGASIMNTTINFSFTTTKTQKLTISWGDGAFSVINLTVGTNTLARNEHEYTDGLDEHTIVFSFEKPKAISAISTLNVDVGNVISDDLKKFTGLQSINFRLKANIEQFPADLSSLTNLIELEVSDSDLLKIDDSLFSLPLRKLSFVNSIDFSETAASESLERLAEFVFLEELDFTSTTLTEFPSNFINRNLLTKLSIGGNNPFTTLPLNIPISVKELQIGRKTVPLTSYTNFDRLVNLEELILELTFDYENLAIGDELASCEKLKTIKYVRDAVITLVRTNAHVNNLFDFIATRGYGDITTGGSDKFRDMTISLIIGGAVNTNNRPSGTYQAPSGFNKNVSNGTPANELEKVYCLVENYGHTWKVGDGNTNSGEETFSPS
jgi:hypothetical protein